MLALTWLAVFSSADSADVLTDGISIDVARDSMKSFQELADEAFADLLAKHGRPVDLKDALRRSTRRVGANDNPKRKR